MLLVKTKIGPSKIHDIGLFANQFIPKGTPIWRFTQGFDIRISKEDIRRLSEPAKEEFFHFAFLNPNTNKYVLCADGARFYNHSDNPNTVSIDYPDEEEGMDIAARDIQVGEELTIDYRTFDMLSQDINY